MIIDYHQISPPDRYKLMAQSIVPRPIAWIATEDEGVINLAPFSYFSPLSSEPPTLIVSVGHRADGSPKDTLANLRKNGRCTLCLVSGNLLEPMHYSSKSLPHEESEAKRFGIEMIERFEGFAPAIKDSPVAFACTLLQEIDLVGSKTRPLILRIEAQYLAKECIKSQEFLSLDCSSLLSRVGAGYALIGDRIDAPKIP